MPKKPKNQVDIDTDKPISSQLRIAAREKMVAAARLEFINALANASFDIEHKVDVQEQMENNAGQIDYNDSEQEFILMGAKLSRKKDKDDKNGGFYYHVKITVK